MCLYVSTVTMKPTSKIKSINHVFSKHHLNIMNGDKKMLPITIQSCLSTQDKKQEFNSDFVKMMEACNMPLEKGIFSK